MGRLYLGLTLGTFALAVVASSASAQPRDLNEAALDWARGRYSAPLMCTFDGEPVRGMRRVLVGPGSRNVQPPVARLVFVELEVEDAKRCFTEFGAKAPNLRGRLEIRIQGTPRPDTVSRDFSAALRRHGGFDFHIVSGKLLVHTVGEAPETAHEVDFRGGEASLRQIAQGSDAARLLSEFASPRKLHLRIQSRDGETYELDMFLSAPR